MGLSYEESEFYVKLWGEQDAMISEVQKGADSLRMWHVDRAFEAIEAAARRVVEKSGGPLSQAQAIDRVLKTREGAVLYDKYLAATEQVQAAEAITEEARGMRELDAWRSERVTEKVQKAGAVFGEHAAREVLERELDTDPALARALGFRTVERRVEKGAGAWGEIERRADRLVSKSGDGLTREQAVDQVLRDAPQLYDAYLAEVEG